MADRSLKLTFLMGRLRAIGTAALLLTSMDGWTGLAAMLTDAECGYCRLSGESELCTSIVLGTKPRMSKLQPQHRWFSMLKEENMARRRMWIQK